MDNSNICQNFIKYFFSINIICGQFFLFKIKNIWYENKNLTIDRQFRFPLAALYPLLVISYCRINDLYHCMDDSIFYVLFRFQPQGWTVKKFIMFDYGIPVYKTTCSLSSEISLSTVTLTFVALSVISLSIDTLPTLSVFKNELWNMNRTEIYDLAWARNIAFSHYQSLSLWQLFLCVLSFLTHLRNQSSSVTLTSVTLIFIKCQPANIGPQKVIICFLSPWQLSL